MRPASNRPASERHTRQDEQQVHADRERHREWEGERERKCGAGEAAGAMNGDGPRVPRVKASATLGAGPGGK